MPATKILWGQILAVFTLILGALVSATQWTAGALGYQPELGSPSYLLLGYPIYPPYRFFWWWFAYDGYAPKIFIHGAMIIITGVGLAIIVAIALSVWRAREADHAETYGSARWARRAEIAAAGLFKDTGVVLGKFANQYLRHDGPEHVLCFAPTRSGKGVGLVLPTLLTWPASAIVHDIKGENWAKTADLRSKIGRVILFDPTNSASNGYNPLLEIRRGAFEVRDAQNIADILVDPEGSLDRRNHWDKTSHALLVGVILHVLYAEADKSLSGAAQFLSDPERPLATMLHVMMTTPHLGEDGVHPVVASAARELLNKSEAERSGVLSTALSFLALYRDPVIARVTRDCDWRINDLVQGDQPVTLYIVVPPSDISRTKPLIRLILNQIGRRLTEELVTKSKRHRVLLMLDEFPALGRLDFFETTLAFMAGYGIKAFLIAQSLNQIEKAYGPNNAILDNCHVRVSFATNDERTAKRVSDALGMSTELRAMKNYAGNRLSPWLSHLMVSRSETARPLLTPGEIMNLPTTDEIVMMSGLQPIRAKKAQYYRDRRLMARVLPPPALTPRAPNDGNRNARNDWSHMSMITAPPMPEEKAGAKAAPLPVSGEAKFAEAGSADVETSEAGDADERHPAPVAGHEYKHEPDLNTYEDIAESTQKIPPEFGFGDQFGNEDQAERNRKTQKRMINVANQTVLDPADDMGMG